MTLDGRGAPPRSYVLGAPDVLEQAGALELPPELRRTLEVHTGAGRRVVVFGEAPERCRPIPRTSRRPGSRRARFVLEEKLRSDAAETIEFMREQQVDLKLISATRARP